jgi:gamma-glutamylcyclotransferase (GGCT)/AIG2-like uncharacterized protein YtfP
MENKTFNLFVYGTLKKNHTANHYLKDAKFIGNATTKDSIFDMKSNRGHYPFVFLNGNKDIMGEIYEVPMEKLKDLDAYEGYSLDGNGLYLRNIFDYVLENGQEIKAIMYYQKDNKYNLKDMTNVELIGNNFIWK